MDKDLEKFKQKSRIPYYFLGLFIFVVAVNIFYIVISRDSWRGVVTENAYEKGLNYNQTIAENKKQKKLGWKIEQKISNIGDKKIKLTIAVSDKFGAIISDAQVTVKFKRPTQEGFDFWVAMEPTGRVYLSEVIFPLKGQWDFEIFASKDEKQVRSKSRYIIQ